MITVRVGNSRLQFKEADSYDYIRYQDAQGWNQDSLTLFDAYGERVATFYQWDGVDAGEPS